MKLIYTSNGQPVRIDDQIIMGDGSVAKVADFAPPRSLASSGKVTVQVGENQREYYVSVIGAEWIEREDRAAADAISNVMYGRLS